MERTISNEDLTCHVVCGLAALAIDNTKPRKQAEETAVMAERNRLARDLHDAVTQTLLSKHYRRSIPRIWERNRDEGMKRLKSSNS